ncbi:MAG: hypothetical protein R3F30_01725 [Planctomycetota bacterium]
MRLRTLPLLVLLPALAACESARFQDRDIKAEGLAPGTMWDICENAARSVTGTELDPVGTDRGLKRMRTKWRTRAQPFRQGYRLRAEVVLLPEGEPPERWTVRYHVERQVNKDIAQAFQPEEDDWGGTTQDEQLEQRLGYLIELGIAQAKGERTPRGVGPGRSDPIEEQRKR